MIVLVNLMTGANTQPSQPNHLTQLHMTTTTNNAIT